MKLSANAARSLVASQSFPRSTSKSSHMPDVEASTKNPEKCCPNQLHRTLLPTYPATDDHCSFQDHLSIVQPHNKNSVCCLEGGKCCPDQGQLTLDPADDNQSSHFVAVQPELLYPGSSLPLSQKLQWQLSQGGDHDERQSFHFFSCPNLGTASSGKILTP